MLEQQDMFLVKIEGGVLTLTFNRPEYRNAMPREAMPLLEKVFRDAAVNPEIRVLLITAKGASFGGGGDVNGMRTSLTKTVEDRQQEYFNRLDFVRGMIEAYCTFPKPIIAVCRGAVAGAAMMYTLGADIVYADSTVFFLCAHQKVGLTPDGGISYLLPRVVGEKKALELILTAQRVDAKEALRIGLVSQIIAAKELDETGAAAAYRLAAAPQSVIRRARKMIKDSGQQDLRSQLISERDNIVQSVGERDFEIGVTAFLEKRKAVFED